MKVEYVIEKVPAVDPKEPPAKFEFPRLPQLYLEFYENKKRVKPTCVNKDYVPPVIDPVDSEQRPRAHDEPESSSRDSSPAALSVERAETPKSQRLEFHYPDGELVRSAKPQFEKRIDEKNADDDASSQDSHISPITTTDNESTKGDEKRPGSAASSKRRQAPLPPRSIRRKTPLNRPASIEPAASTTARKLPSLKELEQQNGLQREKVLLDSQRMELKDADLKRDLMLKFDLLKKSYPRATIPKVNIYEDYAAMERQYEDTLRALSLENSVDNYKQYLTFLFMGIEWFCGKVLKINMEGYVQHQCEQMHKYEKFLVQIGEKNYLPKAKKLPVELQLLIAVLIQTALFVVLRSVFKGAGAGIIGAVNNMRVPAREVPNGASGEAAMAAAGAGSGEPSGAAPRRKMRGPSLNLDELPDK